MPCWNDIKKLVSTYENTLRDRESEASPLRGKNSLKLVCMTLVLVFLFVSLSSSMCPSAPEALAHDWCLGLDWWAATHFTLHFMMGFFFPHMFYFSLIIGILWECYELCLGLMRGTEYWVAKWTDPIVNSLGFLAGMTLFNVTRTTSCSPIEGCKLTSREKIDVA